MTEFVTKLQHRLEAVHHLARDRLQDASLNQQKAYNNRLNYREYEVGDLVYYWYPIKDKNTRKEQFFKWTGPYIVVEQLSTTVYRIQKSLRKRGFVVNHDALKPARAREPVDTSWARDLSSRRRLVPGDTAEASLLGRDQPAAEPAKKRRPRRTAKAPDRLGEWLE